MPNIMDLTNIRQFQENFNKSGFETCQQVMQHDNLKMDNTVM